MEKSIINPGTVTQQIYTDYTADDHETWRMLMAKQDRLDARQISKVYVDGLKKLKISRVKIPMVSEVSDILTEATGWSLVPVTGLLQTKDFFLMLINNEYPVTVSIRRREEADFSQQPDIFHDIVGRLPLLTNELLVKCLIKFSTIAIKYVRNESAVEFLGRFYWYTYEMGLIKEENQNKPYGRTVLTSFLEINNVSSKKASIHNFDINHIFDTPYNPYELQNQYFSITSFEGLFESLELIEEKLINKLSITDPVDNVLRSFSINNNLRANFNNVIGFLNDTQFKYPDAISFVAGQPDEQFFDVEQHISKFGTYVNYQSCVTGQARLHTVNQIAQYNKTNGIINDLLVKYLRNDENIDVKEGDIIVTAGAQEAFSTIVSTICNKDEDLILMEDPSYIGLSSFGKVFGYQIEGVRIDDDGIDLEQLALRILEAQQVKRRIKLVYVIPDYQNPTGACMSVGNRLKLLEMADKYNFLIIEDSVYNSFTYLQKKNPTLKSLDKDNRVIFVGSFSKSLFPGLRIGLIVANQTIENERGELIPLVKEMSKVKAQLSNYTSTVSQAIIGGILLDSGCSLQKYNEPKFRNYKKKNEAVLAALEEKVGKYKSTWSKGITWTKPRGGFFIKIVVPFEVDLDAVVESADKFGIIFSPMRFFYLKEGGEREIRLTFSNLSLEKISEGIGKLADYFRYKILFQENNIENQLIGRKF